MKILVTGAGGFIGKRMAEFLRRGHETVALTRDDLDITDESSVSGAVSQIVPDLIVNCSVLGLEASELDPGRARAVNTDGPANLASAAKEGSAVVHFSTNYVFGGDRRQGYYTIDDVPQPVNVYGETKWAGEQALAADCPRHFIIRTSWVYGGSKTSFFDKAIASIRSSKSIEAVTDSWGSPTLVDDLVKRVEQIVQHGRFGTYHAANTGVCSKYEFAVAVARTIEADLELVKPVFAAQLASSVRRPIYTPISCKLSADLGLPPLPRWERAMKAFISRSEV